MMDLNVLIPVAVLWSVAAMTPGPNFFITVHTAVGHNLRLSLWTVLGIVAGTLLWSISGFLGISLVFRTMPFIYLALKVTGGLYLVLLGVRLLFDKRHRPRASASARRTAPGCFRLGLLTNLLNPKTAVFMASLFAATIPPSASITLGALCVLTICAISAIWYSVVASIFSHASIRRAYEKQKRAIERVSGAIFVGFGIKLTASR